MQGLPVYHLLAVFLTVSRLQSPGCPRSRSRLTADVKCILFDFQMNRCVWLSSMIGSLHRPVWHTNTQTNYVLLSLWLVMRYFKVNLLNTGINVGGICTHHLTNQSCRCKVWVSFVSLKWSKYICLCTYYTVAENGWWLRLWPEPEVFFTSCFSLQCGPAAAAVPGPSSAEKDQDPGSGWGHSSRGHGDRQPDSVHHPLSVWGLHCPDDSAPPQHNHGLHQVGDATGSCRYKTGQQDPITVPHTNTEFDSVYLKPLTCDQSEAVGGAYHWYWNF